MELAFVLDEHLRGPLWQAILRHNLRHHLPLDVMRVGDMAELPLSSDDSTVLRWAEDNSRLLVTEDRHTMATHLNRHLAAGRHSPGILIARSGVRTHQLLECLILIAYAGESREFADVITYLP